MAYSPVEQARLLRNRALLGFTRRHGMTPAQAALAWLLAKENVIAIPKASRREHVQENAGAAAIELSREQLAELDRAFPAPAGPVPLEML
jgi:aldehyde reductase